MPGTTFVDIEFENVRNPVKLLEALQDTKVYEHVAGNECNFIGATTLALEEAAEIIQGVVWEHNSGMFVEVKKVDYADIEHLV